MKILKDEKIKNHILCKLKENIAQCLYLAIDLETCSLNDPNITFYYDCIDNAFDTLIMKYYDTVQLYSPNLNWDEGRYVDFIASLNPIAICAKKEIIVKSEQHFKKYFPEYGIVIADNKFIEFKQFELVREASPQDAHKIAKLLLSTEEFSQNNSLDTLEEQLRYRMSNKLGRSFIIEEDGEIAAHTAIYAECADAAVESGLVVNQKYSKKFYGLIIHEYIKKILTTEKKTLYGLRYNDTMQKSAKNEKLEVMAECGRLILKDTDSL